MTKKQRYFSTGEGLLWSVSTLLILLSFCLFDKSNYSTLIASLIGATSLIFCAKGNPIGPALMIVFSGVYGVISFRCAYYGEMLTYVGMTAPMSVLSLVSWLKNPAKNAGRTTVKVHRVSRKEWLFAIVLTAGVTGVFYFILKAFDTANLLPSTISVATSFFAAYLSFRRSPYFALAYAANDVVLIVLWILAALQDVSYVSVIICFATFLVNDVYGFMSWLQMEKGQNAA